MFFSIQIQIAPGALKIFGAIGAPGYICMRPNNAFKPKLHRHANNMAEKACHVVSYALQFGLT
ncbi:hypothetical protein ACFWZ3_15180 [Frateuria sp. GZRR35]|uniref:hypothetical protein n=1 Tax=unclassified Frateuria TaxID=2648894 RepID=UPI003EDBBCEF